MIKKLPLFLAFLCVYVFSTAQTTNTNSQLKAGTGVKPVQTGLSKSVPPEHRKPDTGSDNQSMASRYATMFTRVLNLNDEQHEKVNQLTLTRITAMKELRARTAQSERSVQMSEEERQIRSQFVQEMDAILTPEQKTKWDQYRLQIKQRKDNIRNGQKDASLKTSNSSSQNTPLLKEDDGFED